MPTLTTQKYNGQLSEVLTEFGQDTAGYYRELRRLGGSKQSFWDDGLNAWIITGYIDCRSLLHSSSLSKSRLDLNSLGLPVCLQPFVKRAQDIVDCQMVFDDSEAATSAHQAWKKALYPGHEDEYRNTFTRKAIELLRSLRGTRVDFSAQVLRPYVSRVISERLGLNEFDRLRLYPLIYSYADFLDGKINEESGVERAIMSLLLLSDFITSRFPSLCNVAPSSVSDGVRWVADYILNLVAGHESTGFSLGIALLHAPSSFLTGRYDHKTASQLLNEALRFDSPIQMVGRVARNDVTLSEGRIIQSGDRVFLHIGAANRDPGRFEHPDKFSIKRSRGYALSFGAGSGRCVGLTLALAEARIFLDVICPLVLEGNLVFGIPSWAHGLAGRSFRELPTDFIQPDFSLFQ